MGATKVRTPALVLTLTQTLTLTLTQTLTLTLTLKGAHDLDHAMALGKARLSLRDAKHDGARWRPDRSSGGAHEPAPPGSEPKVSSLPSSRPTASAPFAEPSFVSPVGTLRCPRISY